jgi:hypothetical protein
MLRTVTAWFQNRPPSLSGMEKGWLVLLLLPMVLFSTAACDIVGPTAPDAPTPQPGELKVLFIGSSYLAVNDMPGIFEELAEAAGKDVFVGRRVQSGFYLDFFAQDAATSQAIRAEEWDYVVLFGGCQTVGYPATHHLIRDGWGQHHPLPALEELKRKVRENHAGTKMVMIMPWAFEDGMTWIPGQVDDYFGMQEKIRENTLAWAETVDFVVAPVGMAWKEVLELNPPEHYLHASDWNHPGARGSFLGAAVVFSTLFQESSEEVPFPWALDVSEATGFRSVASQTVLDSLALWRITP